MSLNKNLIERKGYTILDILSDVGGLQRALLTTISILLSILNYK